MRIANFIAWIILLIGGLNWLMMGVFGINAIGMISGNLSIFARIIYCLVGLAAIWLIITPVIYNGRISLWAEENEIPARRKNV